MSKPQDEWTVAIDAAYPTRSGAHDQYAVAMKMVGNRHEKGDLVALVTWLLVERDEAMRALAWHDGRSWCSVCGFKNEECEAKDTGTCLGARARRLYPNEVRTSRPAGSR